MLETLTAMISTHLYVSQNTQIKTASIEANYLKNNVSLLSANQPIQDSKIIIPSFCDILKSNCTSRILTQKVISSTLNYTYEFVTYTRIYFLKSILMAMALTGYNGDNETNIGLSRTISFSLYDEDNNELVVSNQSKPLEF